MKGELIMAFKLSEIEIACGVTLDQVEALRPKGAFFGELFALPGDISPALGQATARLAAGRPARFSHISRVTGYLMYRVE